MSLCELIDEINMFKPNLICRSTDISKCFRGFLRLRDNESRLYNKILFDYYPQTDITGITDIIDITGAYISHYV